MTGGRGYHLHSQLGQGAFGEVYLAESVGSELKRQVAVKLLRPEKANIPGLIGRLKDEARMLVLIRHRAIVRVDDLMPLDGVWAVVMEYIEGCDLTELLRQGPIPAVAALAIAEEVASALHAAYHQHGPNGAELKLIHRDIKPSNLRVTTQGELKILDFGVARAEFSDREEATREAAFGTVPYMAPERFYGEDSHKGDIYALGVTLFEMLTGTKPGKTAMDADRQPPGEKCRAQWAWLAEISQPLHDLIAAMMAKTPVDRPTARETARLAATIRAALPGETLDEWAERVVPSVLKMQIERRSSSGTGDRTGTILFERSSAVPVRPGAARRGGGIPVWLAGPAALVIGGLAAASLILLFIGLGSDFGGDEGGASSSPGAGSKGSGGTAASGVSAGSASSSAGSASPAAGGGSSASSDPTSTPAGGAAALASSAAGSAPSGASNTPAGAPPSTGGSSAAPPSQTSASGAPSSAASTAASSPSGKGRSSTGAAPASSASSAPGTQADPASATSASPATAAPTGPGSVTMAGDAVGARLHGSGGDFSPGSVPAGSYSADVSFSNGAVVVVRSIVVESGKTTTIRCSAAFQNCKVIRE